MKTIESPHEAKACVLDILQAGSRSAGNIARKMMGVGLLPKGDDGYALVKSALALLHDDGLVSMTGNGKSVHWRLVPKASP